MPTVPRYAGPQVREQPLNPQYQQAADVGRPFREVGAGLNQLGSALDHIAVKVDTAAAWDAEAKVKANWMATDAELRKKYKGANAAPYLEEVEKFWEDSKAGLTEGLSTRAQALVSRSIGNTRLHARASAQSYVTAETDRAQDEAYQASQLAEIQRAAASNDPAVAAVSSALLRQRNAQQAVLKGWTPEMLGQANLKATTALHANMIQGLQQGDPTAAQAYFTANKGEIDGTRHAEIGRALTVATAANDGEKAAAKVWEEQGPKGYNEPALLDKMESAVRKLYPNDAERRKNAIGALRERVSAFNSSQAESNAGAVNTVMGIYNQTRNLAAMKRSPAWSQMPAGKQAEVENHIVGMQAAELSRQGAALGRANAIDARADAAEARDQRRLQRDTAAATFAYSDPAVLAGMSRQQVLALVPMVGNENASHLLAKFDSITRSPEKLIEAKIDHEDFNHLAQEMKLDPYDTKDSENRAALGELRYRVENLINIAQNKKNGALSRDEKQDLMRAEMGRTVLTKGTFTSTSVPVIQLTADQMKMVVVPAADRAQIANALKTMSGRDPSNTLYAPTEANVRRLYLMSKSRAASLLPEEK